MVNASHAHTNTQRVVLFTTVTTARSVCTQSLRERIAVFMLNVARVTVTQHGCREERRDKNYTGLHW